MIIFKIDVNKNIWPKIHKLVVILSFWEKNSSFKSRFACSTMYYRCMYLVCTHYFFCLLQLPKLVLKTLLVANYYWKNLVTKQKSLQILLIAYTCVIEFAILSFSEKNALFWWMWIWFVFDVKKVQKKRFCSGIFIRTSVWF